MNSFLCILYIHTSCTDSVFSEFCIQKRCATQNSYTHSSITATSSVFSRLTLSLLEAFLHSSFHLDHLQFSSLSLPAKCLLRILCWKAEALRRFHFFYRVAFFRIVVTCQLASIFHCQLSFLSLPVNITAAFICITSGDLQCHPYHWWLSSLSCVVSCF
jgi:hypothetical protein